MIPIELKAKFEKVIGIKNINWQVVEDVALSDANILRPIKGVAFEEYFRKIIFDNFSTIKIEDGFGDSDIDLIVNGKKLQLKTPKISSTKKSKQIEVALHKTHGEEKRPGNLYDKNKPIFDFLIVLHPESGILIIPFDSIPENKKWNGYFADPAIFKWESEWLNNWLLLGFENYTGQTLDKRIIPQESLLPNLSKETFLQDFEIIEMLCKPEYFRATVMGLKGNIKEHWFKNKVQELGLVVLQPTDAYSKHDLKICNKNGDEKRIQVKGTSKNMCSLEKNIIGFEIMGTHGHFPIRGYKKRDLDYIAIIISEAELPQNYGIESGLNFIIIDINDLPLHFLISNGNNEKQKGFGNSKWNDAEFIDVLYPNIKLKYSLQNNQVEFMPALDSYKKSGGHDTIHTDSTFRNAGPFILNKIPDEFFN